jgi:glycosyltransferase involved in cell wall biosynthesis
MIMRILTVTNMYPSQERPASGTFVQQQVKGLTDLGLEVELMLVDRLGRGPFAYYGLAARVAKRVTDSKFDLIHSMYGGVMAKTVVKASTSIPVIVSFCGSDLLGENLPGLLRKAAVTYGVWCSRFAARHARGVIVKSKNLWEALPANVDKKSVCIIPNGVDLNRFTPMDSSECRQRLGWEHNRFHVLFPANSGSPVKRFWLAQAAVQEAQRAGVPAELHRLEGVKHEDVPLWLNSSDCLILTSEHEGSPNIVKEALACNVPVVSVDVGDVSERIHGISGCHICSPDPRDLAARLVAVTNGPQRIRSRITLDGLSLNKVAERLIDFYHCVIVEWAKSHECFERDRVKGARRACAENLNTNQTS